MERSSTEKLSAGSVYRYYWKEDEFVKGCDQIASALHGRLRKTNLTNKKTFCLIADGCGGQNMNSAVNGMCYLWLMSEPKHIQVIKLVFPIAGHSFITPDRVFSTVTTFRRRFCGTPSVTNPPAR
jgi:hypothetical protein